MSGCKGIADAGDTIYIYDGSLAGFYCCVYESISFRQMPGAIVAQDAAQPTLFLERHIVSEREKARRVRDSVREKIAPRALELIENGFLSCLPEKEIAILRFLIRGYQAGEKIVRMLGDPDVAPLLAAEKHLMNERQLLLGFVRFSDYGGTLVSTIRPKNFILPFLADHFADRYAGEDFMIYDETHKAALIYRKNTWQIVPAENLELTEASREEELYRSLWKQFYKTVAIQARYNPKCRMTHMPKRYWEHMTEMREYL